MKKIILLLSILFINISVYAQNVIYKIDMDIYLDQNGNARVTEKWDVKGDNGTEWFKRYTNLGNSTITNFTVSMDGIKLEQKNWNINESLEQKKGYYGINSLDEGIELCFGKYDYNHHVFTLNYDISNFVFNASDAQILYWNLIDKLEKVDFQKFSVTISSYYNFPDSLDVWGTGYNGLAYVNNGKIYLSNEEKPNMTDSSYVVALVKFPLNTFNTNNEYSFYSNFDTVKKAFDEGTFSYDEQTTLEKIMTILVPILTITGIIALTTYLHKKLGYGYINNKKIKEKEIPNFRDIPCNKDIFYANSLIKLNNFSYNPTNILGAIILKWVKEEKVLFQKEEVKGLFKSKEEYTIDLRKQKEFNNPLEQKVYNMMYAASEDGLLSSNEFKKYARLNAQSFMDLFKNIEEDEENELRSKGHIYKRKNKNECSFYNVMDDKLYEDAKQLLGLKKFLKEFSEIDKRETIEVHIWDEYLMFAYLFGIADKVFSQLKKLYPEIIEQDINNYNTIMMANSFNQTAVNSAIQAARNYTAGGGGFSTGGGGGGSFGGGGGGSR